MMQITHICITRGFRVPESQFDRKTSFQTRPNPPGGAQPENSSVARTPPFGGAGGKERGVLHVDCGDLSSRSEHPFWGHGAVGPVSAPGTSVAYASSRAGSAGVRLFTPTTPVPPPVGDDVRRLTSTNRPGPTRHPRRCEPVPPGHYPCSSALSVVQKPLIPAPYSRRFYTFLTLLFAPCAFGSAICPAQAGRFAQNSTLNP